ncbi:MAG: right-handed parallel beta-helix repeat-containing protein [Anaerolineaceae bacterium]|nr:right-handed parallel beta-helix repeat-containing protein [Anaerolineaceae bacterium]
MQRMIWLIVMVVILVPGSLIQAQVTPAEADSEAFLSANFNVQDTYNRVLCVAQDGTCPAEITTVVPCLVSACTHPEQTYSISQTFDTIQSASNAAQPGDLVIIMPGRYGGVSVELTGGQDGAYIHFLGWGEPGTIIIDRSADPSLSWLRHHFYFIAAHHYIIQNLEFENATDGAGIFFSGYFSETGQFSHHVIVMDVYSHDNGSWGLHTTSTNYVVVQDSIFTNSREEHGAYLSGSGDNMLIRRNVFQGNNASGLQINADPYTATEELFYWLGNSTDDTCGWAEDDLESVTWHEVKDCYDSQGLPDLGEFIEDGVGEHIIIEQNVITANGAAGGAGINLASVRNSTVRNNLIYGNFAAGIACWDDSYAESKGLGSSQFGCQNVRILANTIVDETGNRGALIITHDARDILVYNNIIVRDRPDAYEISVNSGSGLRSGTNAYFAQYVEESPGFGGEEASFTGFSVSEGLAQFVHAGFTPWILEGGVFPIVNPDRPDYHLLPDSTLATNGNPQFASALDALASPRTGYEIGALVVGVGTAVQQTEAATETPPASDMAQGFITYTLDGQLYRMEVGEAPQNLSAMMDTLSPGTDAWVTISPDGQWLLIETERFDSQCSGWACLALASADISAPGIIYVNDSPLHTEGGGAVASGGNLVVYVQDDGPHTLDIFAVTRSDAGWNAPVLLTGDSPYAWNTTPTLSADGSRLLFDCEQEAFSDTSICEVNTDGSGFRVVLTPGNAPAGYTPGGRLHHADYAPDGSIVFEGEWAGEQIWRLPVGAAEPVLVGAAFNNDNSPCVLPDGRIVSLWLDRPGGQGFHELKIMNADGSGDQMLLLDADIADIGTGCGG